MTGRLKAYNNLYKHIAIIFASILTSSHSNPFLFNTLSLCLPLIIQGEQRSCGLMLRGFCSQCCSTWRCQSCLFPSRGKQVCKKNDPAFTQSVWKETIWKSITQQSLEVHETFSCNLTENSSFHWHTNTVTEQDVFLAYMWDCQCAKEIWIFPANPHQREGQRTTWGRAQCRF